MKPHLTHLDLFSGIGGFAKGLAEAGFEIKHHYFSEIDKHAIANYKYNFPNAKYIGSVTDVLTIIRTIKQHRNSSDKLCITFGSPCQDFSMAGKRSGLKGTKSSLIKYALFLIKWLEPDFFIWENVKGAYSANAGEDYWAIIQAFTNIDGYRLEQQLLNTSWFLPQNRERIYLIGHLAGRSGPGVFPITENDRLFDSTIDTEKRQPQTKINYGNAPKQQDKFYDTTGIMACLSAQRTDNKVNILVKPVLTPGRKEKRQNGRRFKEDGETAFTLTGQDQHGVMLDDVAIRRLTEIECERLQGFDDNWTQYGIYEDKNGNEVVKPIAKTQRYKMIGNAVTVAVVKAVAVKININQ